mgnify:CR=1 FL=1
MVDDNYINFDGHNNDVMQLNNQKKSTKMVAKNFLHHQIHTILEWQIERINQNE